MNSVPKDSILDAPISTGLIGWKFPEELDTAYRTIENPEALRFDTEPAVASLRRAFSAVRKQGLSHQKFRKKLITKLCASQGHSIQLNRGTMNKAYLMQNTGISLLAFRDYCIKDEIPILDGYDIRINTVE